MKNWLDRERSTASTSTKGGRLSTVPFVVTPLVIRTGWDESAGKVCGVRADASLGGRNRR